MTPEAQVTEGKLHQLDFITINVLDFPGGPVAKTPHSQCRRPEFDP